VPYEEVAFPLTLTAMNIDHFMYAGPQLGPLCASFQALAGVEPEPGGQHPQLGTCNRLVGSGGPLYLELIAPDPSSTATSPMRSGIEALGRPGLHRFVMNATGADLDALQSVYARVGVPAQVHDMHRLTPAGATLRWRLLVPEANRFGLFAPFFIDWLDTPHPALSLAPNFKLLRCEAGHPSAGELTALWAELGVDIALHAADAPYMQLLVQTARGNVTLTSNP
jgi:hypothetical protein